jgi:release factor glutamine methyltransferase
MRKFTPYETNQLIKHGFDPLALSSTIDPNIPVEYITGHVEFYKYTFNVSKATLIPRVESVDILEHAIYYAKSNNLTKITFADIGTGSGALGISLAKALESNNLIYDGYLSDISEEALSIARLNLEEIVMNTKANCFTYKREANALKITKSDLLQDYPKNKEFNIILANLPYIPSNRISKLDTSVKDFEPKLALDGGTDGLDYIKKLLYQAPKYLAQKGIVILEVDDTHDEKVAELFSEWDIEVKNDHFDKNRFWICKLFKESQG